MPEPSFRIGIVTRLTLLWSALFAIALAAFTLLAWAGIVREQYEALDVDLSSTATFAAGRIAGRSEPTVQDLEHSDAPEARLFVIENGNVRRIGGGVVAGSFARRLAALRLHRGITLENRESLRAYGVAVRGQPNARVIAVASTRTLQDEQRRSGYGFGVAAGPILVFAIIIGALLAKRSLAPIEKMRRGAAQIAKDASFSRRLNVSGNDELARLATTFDDMLAR